VQNTLDVGGCGNVGYGHVLVAVHQGQRRDAVATGEEQLGSFAAKKSKYTRLYLYSGKLILAVMYLRRVFVDGRSLAAGAPAQTRVCTVGACDTKPQHGPPAALPGQVCGGIPRAMARIAPSQPNEAMAPIAPRF